MPYQADPIPKSKRLIAAAVMLLSSAVAGAGYVVTDDMQSGIVLALCAIAGAAASLLNLLSKIKESKKLE